MHRASGKHYEPSMKNMSWPRLDCFATGSRTTTWLTSANALKRRAGTADAHYAIIWEGAFC